MKLAFVLLLSPLALLAQAPVAAVPPHTIRAVGTAMVTGKPDQARIFIGVTTQAATAADAASQNAQHAQTLLAALKGVVGSSGTIQTSNYSVAPQYKYEQGHAPVVTGYEANNTVEVTLNDIAQTGKAIDAATKAGANGINRIEFTLRDDSSIREEALTKASAAARKNAEAIAKGLGLTVTGVYAAETSESNTVRPLMAPMAKMAMMQASTPVESGNIEVNASVAVYVSVN